MPELDHIAVVAPSLEAGAAHVEAQLGVKVPLGGAHPQMGTHNLLARIGVGMFIEIIAIDPEGAKPTHARWFGLDNQSARARDWAEGLRLRAFVARTDALDRFVASHGDVLGHKIHVSRGAREWDFVVRPDGELPERGALPPLMDWGTAGTPADAMPDIGLRLSGFVLEHPEPERIAALYRTLEIANPPELRKGEILRYRALFDTPNGPRELT